MKKLVIIGVAISVFLLTAGFASAATMYDMREYMFFNPGHYFTLTDNEGDTWRYAYVEGSEGTVLQDVDMISPEGVEIQGRTHELIYTAFSIFQISDEQHFFNDLATYQPSINTPRFMEVGDGHVYKGVKVHKETGEEDTVLITGLLEEDGVTYTAPDGAVFDNCLSIQHTSSEGNLTVAVNDIVAKNVGIVKSVLVAIAESDGVVTVLQQELNYSGHGTDGPTTAAEVAGTEEAGETEEAGGTEEAALAE